MKKTAIFLIKIYQKTISPDHSHIGKLFPFLGCRFYPTCSQYTIEALEKYGILKGTLLGIKRIAKCNPWNKGGIDYLECKNQNAECKM